MTADGLSDDAVARILAHARSFAVVGASANSARPSFGVLTYLQQAGYAVTPVNPALAGQSIAGNIVHASLADVREPIDVVDVFRNSASALDATRDAIRQRERLAIGVVWMQLGVVNEVAAAEARAVGIEVVMDRCPKIEIGRLARMIADVRQRDSR